MPDALRRRSRHDTRSALADVWRRVQLTYRYHGLWAILYRLLTYPLRFTRWRHRLRLGPRMLSDQAQALRWYRQNGRPVSVVIASYRDAEHVTRLVASIRNTTSAKMVRLIVADDASGDEHLAALRRIRGIEIVAGAENRGFAANVNRGLAAADPDHDVVLLNSDVEATGAWLACLQYAAGRAPDVGIVGAKLLYEDRRVQFAGTVRNLGAPEWFDHRYRFRWTEWGPVNVVAPVLAVTGACMYLRRELIDELGVMDEAYPMAYEDVDYCLRAWKAGWRVIYWPAASLFHYESQTRGTDVGGRERESQRVFWERWGDFFDARQVRALDGGLRVIYVTEDTGVGGGHRDVFEHVNALLARGHHPEVWSLSGQPRWFDLQVAVRRFDDYDKLVAALAGEDAIKVATWWNTSAPVWRASVLRGIPVYFVQDIETSYYPDDEAMRHAVLASYRHEFRYITISSWNRDRLRELGLDAELIPPGIDRANFRPLPESDRRTDMVLAIGRSHPLKNLPLTIAAWRTLPEPRPELCLFGIEPELATDAGMRYVNAPTDAEVNELFNAATVFVQTSIHEGFCLPALESMATGGAVVCTDAHGNRDFCADGQNCLIAEPAPDAVAAALTAVLGEAALRERLGAAGIATAADYAWEKRIDALEAFLEEVARARRVDLQQVALPQPPPAQG